MLFQTFSPIIGNMMKLENVHFIFYHVNYELVENLKNLSSHVIILNVILNFVRYIPVYFFCSIAAIHTLLTIK